MNILITGGSGFIGRQLVSELSTLNHHITILTRNVSSTSKIFGREKNIEYCTILDQIPSSSKIDYIINLAGAQISASPWTICRKQCLVQSRTSITENIISLIHRLKTKPKKLINASAIGWYGINYANTKLDETFETSNSSFSHILCEEWEKAASKALEYGVDVDILRFGVVLGKEGGMLKKLDIFFKLGMGFYAGDGKQNISWIHIKDVVLGVIFLLNHESTDGKSEIYNFTAPYPVTNIEFSIKLAQNLHRPLLLRAPKFMIKILLGKMGEELLLSDLSCFPQNLSEHGYQFKYANLNDALENIYPS